MPSDPKEMARAAAERLFPGLSSRPPSQEEIESALLAFAHEALMWTAEMADESAQYERDVVENAKKSEQPWTSVGITTSMRLAKLFRSRAAQYAKEEKSDALDCPKA